MNANQWILIIVIGLVILAFAGLLLRIAFRKRRPGMDELEGREFEYYCAELLRESGFLEVEVTKGSGDFGVDILAQRDGVSYAVQCKRYDGPVGVHAVMEVYAGRDYYDSMVGVVMSNQYFTEPAVQAAAKLKIMLWDRGYLDTMEEELEEKRNERGVSAKLRR